VRRREFITLIGGAAAWPLAARGQQPAMPLVGVMSPLSIATAARNIAALRNRLRELGYIEGTISTSSIGSVTDWPSASPCSSTIWLRSKPL
jgi:putative ABC transport system substrate-binding protein